MSDRTVTVCPECDSTQIARRPRATHPPTGALALPGLQDDVPGAGPAVGAHRAGAEWVGEATLGDGRQRGITMSWKDDYREDKAQSGLSWSEYHQRKFVHVDDLDGMAETVGELEESVAGLRSEYRRLRWELHEVLLC